MSITYNLTDFFQSFYQEQNNLQNNYIFTFSQRRKRGFLFHEVQQLDFKHYSLEKLRLKSAEFRLYNNLKVMLGEGNKTNQLSDHSLCLDPDFSQINLLQENLKYAKRSHLKVQSKIRGSTKSKEKCSSKKRKDFQKKSQSCSRKKSKTCQRSPEKNKRSNKKLGEINSLKQKKGEKVSNPKISQGKSKSIKPLKTIILKKPSSQSVSKKQNIGEKKKAKIQASKKTQKTYKTRNQKPKGSNNLKKTKSQTALDLLTLSQISKKPNLGSNQSKVIHQYFGMQNKLSSNIQQDGKAKSNVLKLSKCKTHSSIVSIRKQGKFKNSHHKK